MRLKSSDEQIGGNINRCKVLISYSLPADVIRIRSIFDENGQADFTYKKEGQKIFSNNKTAFVEYVQDMNETTMPSFFVEALVSKVATEINEAITASGSLTQRLAGDFNKNYVQVELQMDKKIHHKILCQQAD